MRRASFEIKATNTSADGAGSFEAVLSAPVLDRDGEVIDAKAFARAKTGLPDWIPIHIDHDMSVRGLVASARPFYDGDTLKAAGTYASTPLAQTVRTMISEGHLRTMSVGFMDAKSELAAGVRHITSAELLEASFVTVPSNRDALITGSKRARLTDQEAKAIAGSYEALRSELADAVRAAGYQYPYVLATFPDRVVFESWDGTTDLTLSAAWTRGEDGTISLATAEPVQVLETIQPAKSPAEPAATKAAGDAAEPELDLALMAARAASSFAALTL